MRGRRWLLAAGIVLVVVIVIRLVLDPIAGWATRRELHQAPGIDGNFERVHVTVFPPGYEIHRLKIIEDPGGSWKQPLLYTERASVWLDWRLLLHGAVGARLRLDDPKVIVEKRPEPPKKPGAKKPTELPDVRKSLESLLPAHMERFEVRNGEILFRDLTEPRHPEIWVHGIEAAAENLATRPKLAHGQPTTLAAHGRLGRSGTLTVFVSADAFARKPDFAGNLALRGWKLAELYDLEEPKTQLQTPQGTLDVFAEFKARDGAISGGVKPVLKNVEVKPTQSSLGNRLKAWVADEGLHLFSDDVPGRNAVATVIPIEGRLDKPDVQLWPSVLGVVRNAFVQGLSSGYAHLPPAMAEQKQGPLTQVGQALKKKEGPPKAQPAAGQKQAGDKK
ncbi:MAG TPA: DUF748 domain-containing protein [Polyangia bacterium]|nr:DUF748 domain-containing protein [Polyangia bacterium]